MKKFVVVYDETYEVIIDARSAKKAEKKFLKKDYDNEPRFLEIGGYDVLEVDDEDA